MAASRGESPDEADGSHDQSPSSQGNGEEKTKAEEPPRQKRKKARRACLACQRAHLTCSDERPCQRCIKRGLQADCHDGVRKKAKYLHDAPNDALMPGVGQNYISPNGNDGSPTNHRRSEPNPQDSDPQDGSFVPNPGLSFNGYAAPGDAPQVHLHNTAPFSAYGAQASPMSAQFNSQQTSPLQTLSTPIQSQLDNQTYMPFLDANDPSTFNFDVSEMNFGNRYGALEFTMLNQMSSGVNENPMQGCSTSFESPSVNNSAYIANSPDANFMFIRNNPISDWQSQPAGQNASMNQWASQPVSNDGVLNNVLDDPNAYSIGALPISAAGASPGTNHAEVSAFGRDFPPSDNLAVPPRPRSRRVTSQSGETLSSVPAQRGEDGPNEAISKKLEALAPSQISKKRERDPTIVYSTVTKSYPYTAGFHALFSILHRRFSSQKKSRIAQALSSIRPSFISCTRTLVEEDLVFMEKCFQRQLWEYEDFVGACGTPTLVCRRTGEVAYVGKEFTDMTGWRKSVLLGSEPNLNVNKGGENGANSGTVTGSSSRGGVNTPRLGVTAPEIPTDRPQPVFLAELLDDDDVVQFYEDFAKLAFADSKGSVSRRCKLLKYRTKDDPPFSDNFMSSTAETQVEGDSGISGRPRHSSGVDESQQIGSLSAKKRKSVGGGKESHKGKGKAANMINSLGDKDGKVDCMYCWTVKRDVFDIPLMIVINKSVSSHRALATSAGDVGPPYGPIKGSRNCGIL